MSITLVFFILTHINITKEKQFVGLQVPQHEKHTLKAVYKETGRQSHTLG